MPPAVCSGTEEYREEQDTLGQFVEECCEKGPDFDVSKADLYAAYRDWTGGRCCSKTALTREMRKRGFDEKRGHNGVRMWCGISLTNMDLGHGG